MPESLLIKLPAPAILFKKRLWHRRFPVNFAKNFKNTFHRTPPGDCFCTGPVFRWDFIVLFEKNYSLIIHYLLINSLD